jgi:hypothetical protein
MTNVTVTEAIAYDCGHRAGHAARDAEVETLTGPRVNDDLPADVAAFVKGI